MNEDRSIAGFLRYLAENDRALAQKARGADAALIARFETAARKLTGLSLPIEYKDFLRTMGERAPLEFTEDARTELKRVMNRYEILLEDAEKFDDAADELPENCLFIAVGGLHIEEVVLQCSLDASGNTIGGALFVPDADELREPMADGLINLLYHRAFEHFCATKRDATAFHFVQTGENKLPALAEQLARMNWHKHWFSDSIALCATAPDNATTLFYRQRPNEHGWLRVGGANKNQTAQTVAEISRALQVTFAN